MIFSISAGPTPAGAALIAIVRLPNGSVSKPVRVQLVGDSRVLKLLCRGQLQERSASAVAGARLRPLCRCFSTFSNRIRS